MTLDLNTIMTWNLETLYKYVLTIEEELSPNEKQTLKKIEKGEYSIPVHINYYIKEYYTEFPSSNRARIYGLGKVELNTLWEDIHYRETQLRNIIIERMDDDTTEERIV